MIKVTKYVPPYTVLREPKPIKVSSIEEIKKLPFFKKAIEKDGFTALATVTQYPDTPNESGDFFYLLIAEYGEGPGNWDIVATILCKIPKPEWLVHFAEWQREGR